MILGSKSNEIPAVQGLLEELGISGCIIVADAFNFQKKTAEFVISGGTDYVLDIKDNQPCLNQNKGAQRQGRSLLCGRTQCPTESEYASESGDLLY